MYRHRLRFRRRTVESSLPPAAGAVAEAIEPRQLLSAFMVKDVNPTPPFQQAPTAAGFFEVNGALLFGAPDGAAQALYRTDGTPAGTAPLHPVARLVFLGDPTPHLTIGNVAYFTGLTPGQGAELWKTDGTAAGTVMVKDISPGAIGSVPQFLTDVGGTLYFAATDGAFGREIWKSDGTEAGTVRVTDTPLGLLTNAIKEVEAVGNAVYFSSHSDATVPGILWKTDGSPAGATAVKQFAGGTLTPSDLQALGDLLVFNGFDSTHAKEPWVSDGTPEGTRLLKDIRPRTSSSNYSLAAGYFRFGDSIYFSAYTDATAAELWKTDGTPEGTVLVEDLSPGATSADPRAFVEMDGVMYFLAFQSDGTSGSTHLFRSDGTAEGTFPLKAVPAATQLVASGGRLFVGGAGGLWKSNGTEAGTVLVQSFPGAIYSLTPYRGGAAFQANEGTQWLHWFSDGTPQGTVSLGDLDRRTSASVIGATSPIPVSLGDKVLFTAAVGTPTTPSGTLQVTDGTHAGTKRLSDVWGVNGLTRVGDAAFFFAANVQADTRNLWRTDGTAEGTRLVLDTVFTHGKPVAVGNALYFGARSIVPDSPAGLYRSDGTAEGTVFLKAVPTQHALPANITAVGNLVYFTTSYGGGSSFDLWKSDGTEAGTGVVKQFTGGSLAYVPTGLTDVNGKLVFRTHRGSGDTPEIWVSDGTAVGTMPLMLFAQTSGGSYDLSLTAYNGSAYFVASATGQGTADAELWKTDGTFGGTVRVKDIYLGSEGSNPRGMTVANGRLFFSAVEPTGGIELWSTDGTDAGTSRVIDLRPGTNHSFATPVGAFAGRLYFTANDGSRGYELWSTDGTAGGTAIVADVYPGSLDTAPRPLTPVPVVNAAAGDRVIFWADDGIHGVEPWSAPRPGTPTNDFVRGRHLFYNNSRFDGRTPGASRSDDGAIAPDKVALFPGPAASFDNISGYSRGLNGVMIDVDTRFPFSTDVVITFRIGTGAPGAPWTAAPTPLSIGRRNDGLPEDIDRITVIWPDNSIRNTWLQVTIEALSDTGVAGRDLFYFGHLAGETGDATAPAGGYRVNSTDFARTRAAMTARPAGPANRFDHNRDGIVNVLDVNTVRGNFLTALPPPTTTTAAEPVAAARKPARYRPGLWAALAK